MEIQSSINKIHNITNGVDHVKSELECAIAYEGDSSRDIINAQNQINKSVVDGLLSILYTIDYDINDPGLYSKGLHELNISVPEDWDIDLVSIYSYVRQNFESLAEAVSWHAKVWQLYFWEYMEFINKISLNLSKILDELTVLKTEQINN